MSIEPKVVQGYVAWWLGVHPIDLGMDEDEEGEGVPTFKGSSEDEPY